MPFRIDEKKGFNEIRVPDTEWSEGIWHEIRQAERLNIPALTDQKKISKTVSAKADNEHEQSQGIPADFRTVYWYAGRRW